MMQAVRSLFEQQILVTEQRKFAVVSSPCSMSSATRSKSASRGAENRGGDGRSTRHSRTRGDDDGEQRGTQAAGRRGVEGKLPP